METNTIKMEKSKEYNVIINNIRNLIYEHPEEDVILECLYQLVYEPKLVDSDVVVAVYEALGTDAAKEYVHTIKVNEGW